MITAFVDMVGLLMIIPLLPFYAKHDGRGRVRGRAARVRRSPSRSCSARRCGAGSPITTAGAPRCSSGLAASAIAYVIFAFARLARGCCSSRESCRAPAAGRSASFRPTSPMRVEPEERAKALGWLSAATNVGVAHRAGARRARAAVGPRGPGLLAAALCLVNIVFAWKLSARIARHDGSRRGAKPAERARAGRARRCARRHASRASRRRG